MRGSIKWQVQELYMKSGINQVGQSKHAAKELVRQVFEDQNKHADWHDLGQNIGIFSLSTSEDYQAIWRQILAYSKDIAGVKDIEQLTPEIVADYLTTKVEQGVAKSTFDVLASAAEKLAVALNWYSDRYGKGHDYDFSTAVKKVRAVARQELDKTVEARAYSEPRALVAATERPEHQLAGAIQLEAGSRLRECSNIKATDLKGLRPDPVSRQMMGWYTTRGKGGKRLWKMVSTGTYAKLERHIKEHGAFRLDGTNYRDSLKKAATLSGQQYYGSHGLRWNYAQERYREIQEYGRGSLEAMKIVSEELGHNRIDITMHYLRG